MSHTSPTSYSSHQTGFTSSASMAERNDLHDLSPDELELECQHLRDENHQLQLRILGVNELARLLQDRSELVQVLEEKNKRLEIAVVRLENRCANYDRTLKSQKGANVPTAKPGQSPFIPGPSRQILEGLMKENSDLKKTVSSLTGKGAAGYLEAVKATQLEEVIDQQKQEIEFLKDQINQLTSTGLIEEKSETSVGQLTSLPATVSESGPLKRQLIQLQRAMKVKDRFCTLLSQQVAQLQNRLASLEFQDGESGNGQPQQESSAHEAIVPQSHKKTVGNEDQGDGAYKKLYEEANETLTKEREQRLTLVEKMASKENELKDKNRTIDSLEQRCDELTSYHQTLLMEKSELNQMLTETNQKMENLSISGGESPTRQPGRSVSDSSMEQLKKELKNCEDQINDLRAQLEEANVRTAIADSKLGEIESKHAQQLGEFDNIITVKNQEVRNYQDKIQQNEQQISDLSEQVKDLEEDVRAHQDSYSNLLQDITEGKYTRSRPTGGISREQLGRMTNVRSGGAPPLFGLESNIGPDDVTVKDYAGTPQQHQKIRNPTVGTPLLTRDIPEGQPTKQPPTNLGLLGTTQQPGRASPGPHHMTQQQLIQSKGHPQPHPQPHPQLPTPNTPVAPNQISYATIPSHSSYTHPVGTSGSGYMSSSGAPPTTQMTFAPGSVTMNYGQPRVQGQGTMMQSRPRTMHITSPSTTQGSVIRTPAASVPAGRGVSYTMPHGYVGSLPTSTVAQYGGSGIPDATYQSTSYGGGNVYGGGGGRGIRGSYNTTGQSVFGGMSGNSHASHLYNTGSSYPVTSPQLQHQQHGSFNRADSGSSGYNSGEMYSGGVPGSSGMRPTSPRSSYNQPGSTGGYPGAQGGVGGQYGPRPTSPRSYDPSGGYPGGQGGGAGGQHNFPPRGPH